MKDLVAAMNKQITEAIKIGQSINFKKSSKKIDKILCCGLGGSGIGGVIVSQLLRNELKVPFVCANDYNIPAFVDENTLIIASSYSGNTEETLAAVEMGINKGAEICVITSGGRLAEMALANHWNYAFVPGGEQPRAMLTYSIVQQLFMLNLYGLCTDKHIQELSGAVQLIDQYETDIQQEAKSVADELVGHTPIIYADSLFGGLATRFKQQLNENSKELCWDHVLPEMTHNELVGWAGGKSDFAPVYLATNFDHPRTTYRWKIAKEIIGKYTGNISEIHARGGNMIEQLFYLIHLTDWVSVYLAENKKIDPVEVNVITHLKSEMSKI